MNSRHQFPPPTGMVIEQCRSMFEPLTAEVIERVCEDNGWSLPQDYKHFLLEWNGFEGDEVSLVFSSWDDEVIESDLLTANTFGGHEGLHVLFGLGQDLYDLRYMQNSYFFHELRTFGTYLSIGCCCGPAVLCLSLNERDFGTVYWWISSDDDSVEPPEMLLHVATSFTQFWKKLKFRR